jgi:RecB family exonuclease
VVVGSLAPVPLPALSFSRFLKLRQCHLSGAALAAPAARLAARPPSGRGQVVGELLHTIMQKINETPTTTPVVGREWRETFDDVVEAMRARIALSPVARHLGDPRLWPELTGVYRRMTDVLRRRSRDGEGVVLTVHAETDLRSMDGLLFGRLDAYFERTDGIELVDYKSGAVLDDEGPKSDYEDQLYFYAYLVKENHGQYPRSLRLVGKDGVVVEIEPSPGRSNALAQEMRDALAAYNAAIEAKVDVAGLASPSASACADCDMKSRCTSFWDALPGIQLPNWAHVAVGVLARPPVRSRLGASSFDLDIMRSSLGVSQLTVTRMFEDRYPELDLDGMVGQTLIATSLRLVGDRTRPVVQLTDRSLVVRLEREE